MDNDRNSTVAAQVMMQHMTSSCIYVSGKIHHDRVYNLSVDWKPSSFSFLWGATDKRFQQQNHIILFLVRYRNARMGKEKSAKKSISRKSEDSFQRSYFSAYTGRESDLCFWTGVYLYTNWMKYGRVYNSNFVLHRDTLNVVLFGCKNIIASSIT